MNYYSRSEVSNSDLSKLKNDINGVRDIDLTDAYLFGSIVDAMITEPNLINYFEQSYQGVSVDKVMWRKALTCRDAFNKSRFSMLINGCEFQKVSIKDRIFEWNGIEFWLPCRCKWDFFGDFVCGDIKTTQATSQKAFIDSCDMFGYWRQAAWYMDLEDRDVFIFIGISKVNYKIFTVKVERGDENYLKGKQEYLDLAFKYWVLKD